MNEDFASEIWFLVKGLQKSSKTTALIEFKPVESELNAAENTPCERKKTLGNENLNFHEKISEIYRNK